MSTVSTRPTMRRGTTSGTLRLTLPGDAELAAGGLLPTPRDVSHALDMVQATLNLGWTSVPFVVLADAYPDHTPPGLPRYRVLEITMASPLALVLAVPSDVLDIPIAITGLTLAIERVLNCKVRVIERRERLQAEAMENRERRLLAEERIQEHLESAAINDPNRWRLRAMSAELFLEDK